MMLKNKNAVIYGASGGIGGAVARAFAHEEARVFLTGRDRASVDAVANDIVSAGGSAVAAGGGALDQQAVDTHLQSGIGSAGRGGILFYAGGRPHAQNPRVPPLHPAVEQFSPP